MVKFLRYSLMSALVMLCSSVFAQTEVTFDFDTDGLSLLGLSDYSSSSKTDGDITEAKTATVDGVLVTISPKSSGSNANRLWSSSPRLRCYSGTITITAPDGYNLTAIDFVNGKWNTGNKADNGELASGKWSGNSNSVVVTIGGNTQIKKIVATIIPVGADVVLAPTISAENDFLGNTEVSIEAAEGCDIYYTIDGTDPTTSSTKYTEAFKIWETATVKAIAVKDDKPSDIAEKTYNRVVLEASTIGYLNEKTEDQAWIHLKFEEAVVTYVDGNNIYLRERDKALMLYGIDFSAHEAYPIKVGDKLAGSLMCDYDNYYGIHEVKANKFTDISEVFVAEGSAPAPTQVTLTDILNLKNICDYVVVQGTIVSEVSGTKTNYFVVDEDGNKVQLYKGLDVSGFAGDGKKYYITAVFNAIYSGAAELQPITVTENDPTAISNVNAETASDRVIYNIAGQRMNKLSKGINIVNGKKIIK